VLGGPYKRDNVITNNQTRIELAEDATVTRNAGFTLGGINFANKVFTLGSATTDLTLVDNSSTNTSRSWNISNKAGRIYSHIFRSY
jgi:hypothetical protein